MSHNRKYEVRILPENRELSKVTKHFFAIGFKYVSFGIVTSRCKASIYSSNDEWGAIYLEKGLFEKDPSLDILMSTKRVMFPWSSLEKSDVIRMKQKACGLEDGISIFSHFKAGGGAILELGVENKNDMKKLAWNFPIAEVKTGMEEFMTLHKKFFEKEHNYENTLNHRSRFETEPIIRVVPNPVEGYSLVG
ncbi:MAG: hypothetical protein HOL16_02615 [Alphaproteobacteria bacterium]|jgi:hypothetical protein|nr:hypothetical protein [Alphaproteobacteria bacterium]